MTPRERLDAALAKPPTAEDIKLAVECMIDVQREANRIRGYSWGKMNPPQTIPGHEAAEFASRVLDLVYHAQWMARKLRNQLEEKPS